MYVKLFNVSRKIARDYTASKVSESGYEPKYVSTPQLEAELSQEPWKSLPISKFYLHWNVDFFFFLV